MGVADLDWRRVTILVDLKVKESVVVWVGGRCVMLVFSLRKSPKVDAICLGGLLRGSRAGCWSGW